jgi:hypothetical protein
VKRGLVRISRKDNKSIILHLERCTKRPGHAVDTLAGPFAIQLEVCVASLDALPYPHGSAATGEGRAPAHYGIVSGARTEAVVEESVRKMSQKALGMLKHIRKQIFG